MDSRLEQRLGTVLGVLGLVVAVIGLAGPLPKSTPLAIALIAGGVIGAAIGVVFLIRARTMLPFSLRSQTLTYEITKPDGSECICSKKISFRCNLRQQMDFVHRNIFGNTPPTDFRWEGDGTLTGPPQYVAGEWIVAIRRLPFWPIGKMHGGVLTYTIANTFPGAQEWVAYVCDRETQEGELIVKFPKARTCNKAWAVDQRAGQQVQHDDGVERLSAYEIRRVIQRPKVGSEYYIYWGW